MEEPKVKKIAFGAIDAGLNFQKFQSLEEAFASNPILVIKEVELIYTNFYNRIWKNRTNEYTVFNNFQIEIDTIEANGWKLSFEVAPIIRSCSLPSFIIMYVGIDITP